MNQGWTREWYGNRVQDEHEELENLMRHESRTIETLILNEGEI